MQPLLEQELLAVRLDLPPVQDRAGRERPEQEEVVAEAAELVAPL
jgi:hypothetical protein